MINIDKDKLCDEITDIVEKTASSGYNHAYAERLADELIERLVENLTIPDVSNLLAFLTWYRQHPELHDWSVDIVLKEYQKANCC